MSEGCKFKEGCSIYSSNFSYPLLTKDYFNICEGSLGNNFFEICPWYELNIGIVNKINKKLGLEASVDLDPFEGFNVFSDN